jgi:hypothetical protein
MGSQLPQAAAPDDRGSLLAAVAHASTDENAIAELQAVLRSNLAQMTGANGFNQSFDLAGTNLSNAAGFPNATGQQSGQQMRQYTAPQMVPIQQIQQQQMQQQVWSLPQSSGLASSASYSAPAEPRANEPPLPVWQPPSRVDKGSLAYVASAPGARGHSVGSARVAPFLTKLYAIVEEKHPDYHVSWFAHTRARAPVRARATCARHATGSRPGGGAALCTTLVLVCCARDVCVLCAKSACLSAMHAVCPVRAQVQ